MSRNATSWPWPAMSLPARARASAATRSFWKTRGLICGTSMPRSCRRVAIIGNTSTGSGAWRHRSVSKTSRLRTLTSGFESRLMARVRRASVVRASGVSGCSAGGRAVTFTGAGKRSSGILANPLSGGLFRGRRPPHLLAQRAPRPDLRVPRGGRARSGGRDRVGGRGDDAAARLVGRRARHGVHHGGAVPDRRGAGDGRDGAALRARRGPQPGGARLGAARRRLPRRRRPQPLDGAARAGGDLRGRARAAYLPPRRRLAVRPARPVLLGRRAAPGGRAAAFAHARAHAGLVGAGRPR